MHIHLTLHHVPLTSALRNFTMNKVTVASEGVGPDVAAHVVLRRDPKATRDRRFIARIRFLRRGTALVVSGTDASLRAAIDQMVGKITGGPDGCRASLNTGDAQPPRVLSHPARKIAVA